VASLARRCARAGRTLSLTAGCGALLVQATGSRAVVGTNVVYAAIHQMGGQAGRGGRVKIPARPFLMVQDEDWREIGRQLGGLHHGRSQMIAFTGFDDWIPSSGGGRQIDGNGRVWDGDSLIEKAISSFDRSQHEPPVVVGHPRHDAPAFGWVEGLKREGDLLLAKFRDVVPEFSQA
jgi:hypothetical protein